MGQEIVYCHECQSRLIGSEFDKGKAFRIQNQNYCLPCAQKLLNSLPPHERDAFAALMTAKDAKKSTQRIPIVADPRPRTGETGRHAPFRPDSTNARMSALPPRKPKSSPLLWVGLGGALAAVALVVAVASSGGGPTPGAAPSTVKTTAPKDLAPTTDVRLAEARKLLEAAKAYAAANPSDAIGQIDRFSKAAWHAPGTPVADTAQAEIDAIRRRSRERQQRELAELDHQVMALTSKKDFATAERLLEAAKGRHLDTDWSLGIKRRLADLAALSGGTRPPAPAPPPPPPPPVPAVPPIAIYDDALQNGWLDHSWGSEVDYAFAGHKSDGSRSIRWWPKQNAAGLYLGPAQEQPLAELTGITFALYGLEPQLPVTIGLWTEVKPNVNLSLQNLGPPPPGQWKTYVIPFKDLNLRGSKLTGVVFQAFRHEANGAPLLCVDAISLLRATPDRKSGVAPADWTTLEVIEARSLNDTQLRAEADGVVAASGPNPEKETYFLKLKSPLKGIQAIRLDALAHPTLPGGGPGRSDGNGNFVLTELRVEAAGKPVGLQDVVADYSQTDWAVEGAFDGHPLTGWAIHPMCGQHHHLVVRLREPLDAAELTVTLEQQSPHHRHVLGRFRLSATAVRPPDPPAGTPVLPTAGALALRRSWYAAALHAAARDYPAAIREFEAVAKTAGEEGAADLADLRLAARLHEDALALLAKWPMGWNLEAEIVMPDGALRRVNESVRGVRGTFLSLRNPGLPGLEAGQLTAGALADLVVARKASPQDVRAAGLLCAFEGDLAAARKHLGGLPSKFEGHARSLPPPDDPAEADARRRLLEAELAWADRTTRAGAIDGFSALLKDRAETLLVRRCAAGLRSRAESPIEYVFGPGDLSTGGYFGAQRHPKGELAWTMAADAAGKDRADHYVEAAYSVRPGAELRGWALVGGCCAETFAFGVTATDLPPPSPEQPATEVVPSIPFLKRTHALHGGPKHPSRFEWASLPALKHAEGGAKRLRILSDQEGFSVVAVLLSAGRAKPPSESELRDLLAGRPLPEPGLPGPGGTILHEVWENASGSDMASLAPLLAKPPTKTSKLKAFSSPQNWANEYGTRIRGYVHPPESGAYVFYLCSDDDAELWLSTDESPEKKRKIAWVTSAMDFNAWDDAKPRASETITLQRGRRYYIEGLQKEGGGDDHLRVGWKLPDGTLERPIPGRRLSPWDPAHARSAPEVLVEGGPFGEGAAIPLTVDLAGLAASRVEFFQGATRLGDARGTPPAFTWTQAPAGAHVFWARLQERSGRVVNTHVVPLRVGDVHLVRAVNLNGPALKLDGSSWADGGAATVSGQGFERLDVDLRPEARRARAQMIRASVAAREGTQAAVAVPNGKYLVYLTLWEPEGPPAAVDLLVNGKVVAAGHRFAAPGDWARLGPWPAEAVDGRITVSAARGLAHFSGLEIWSLGAPPKPSQRAVTALAGGTGGASFEDVWAEGSLLMTGIRVSELDGKLSSVRPIWGTVARGEYHGTSGGRGTDLLAKEGYAVGAVEVRAASLVNEIRVIFFRLQGDRLNPGDRYESEWYPGPPGSSATTVVGGDGNPVIGLAGRAGKHVDALGLIQLK